MDMNDEMRRALELDALKLTQLTGVKHEVFFLIDEEPMIEPAPVYYHTLREANLARQKEWDTGNQLTPEFRGNELAGEVGETLDKALDLIQLAAATGRVSNIVKKLARERLGLRGSRATPEDLAEELADLRICADLVGMDFDIDVEAATRDKFNATSLKLILGTRLAPPPSELLGATVRIIMPGFENHEHFKVVSLRLGPEGEVWASVIEKSSRHRGYGVYDGETTDIQIDKLEIVKDGERYSTAAPLRSGV